MCIVERHGGCITTNIMKTGDKVIHRLTGHQMTIKRLNGSVATLTKEPEIWVYCGIEHVIDVAVCHVENLVPVKTKQLSLI